ncbi:MAG: helix-hairpin-helix domain-containing protein [Tannerella sp.]|jgi:DNA uptake protein ComE-like DNA-binding protein|nr:helix-hairpin-helix domain-containing protein [Tannerella sp.]
MFWRDFFYFSRGERYGLIVLLCLITIAGILLIWNDRPAPESNTGLQQATVESRDSDSLPSETVSAQREKPVETAKNGKNNPKRNIPESKEAKSKPAEKKESVSERVERLTSYSRPSYPRTEKFREGTVVELNTADTVILKKVPGIGSTFAKRIISYRNLLGGYYSVMQLSEVYGIDEDKYNALAPWFSADFSLVSRLNVNSLSQDSLRRHPYINYEQAKVIAQLRRQKGKLTGWENLLLLNEFTDADRIRLQNYLSFE